jgi:hypothetical protein
VVVMTVVVLAVVVLLELAPARVVVTVVVAARRPRIGLAVDEWPVQRRPARIALHRVIPFFGAPSGWRNQYFAAAASALQATRGFTTKAEPAGIFSTFRPISPGSSRAARAGQTEVGRRSGDTTRRSG